MMKPIDSHCHLDFEDFDSDRDEVIERSRKKLESVVSAGVNYRSNKSVLTLQKDNPDFVKATLGLHPTYTDSFEDIDKIKRQIKEEDPVAVGEIGLDHHHVSKKEMRKKQKVIFKEMLSIAEELDKPVVVHSRDAESKCVEILGSYSIPEVFLHCFNGETDLAKKAADRGYYIGVTTQVLYSNRVQEISRSINLESMLLETDSPFLYRGDRNEPLHVLESAEKLSEIKGISKTEVIETTTSNARNVFE